MLSKFLSTEDGYYALTQTGYIATVILIIVAVLLTAVLVDKKQNTGKFSAKQLAFSGIALSLGFIMSYIKVEIPLWSMGGSVTLFSMFFICLIGYWYGIRVGLVAAFAYSLLQFIQSGGAYMLTPFQVCCDYFFAFTALGVSGFFAQKKNGLLKGYLLAIFLRGLFHTIGGYLYWMEYMPDSFPKSLTVVYPFVYNYSFIIAEGVLTIILISIPAVKKALDSISKMAIESNSKSLA